MYQTRRGCTGHYFQCSPGHVGLFMSGTSKNRRVSCVFCSAMVTHLNPPCQMDRVVHCVAKIVLGNQKNFLVNSSLSNVNLKVLNIEKNAHILPHRGFTATNCDPFKGLSCNYIECMWHCEIVKVKTSLQEVTRFLPAACHLPTWSTFFRGGNYRRKCKLANRHP